MLLCVRYCRVLQSGEAQAPSAVPLCLALVVLRHGVVGSFSPRWSFHAVSPRAVAAHFLAGVYCFLFCTFHKNICSLLFLYVHHGRRKVSSRRFCSLVSGDWRQLRRLVPSHVPVPISASSEKCLFGFFIFHF